MNFNFDFYFNALNFNPEVSSSVLFILSAIMIVALLICIVTDLKWMIIPDAINFPAIIISLIVIPIIFVNPLAHYVTGILCAIVFTTLSFTKIRGEYGFGMGDTKLYIWLGLIFAQAIVPIILLASILGLLTHLILNSLNKHEITNKLPHGPQIVVATFIVWILCLI